MLLQIRACRHSSRHSPACRGVSHLCGVLWILCDVDSLLPFYFFHPRTSRYKIITTLKKISGTAVDGCWLAWSVRPYWSSGTSGGVSRALVVGFMCPFRRAHCPKPYPISLRPDGWSGGRGADLHRHKVLTLLIRLTTLFFTESGSLVAPKASCDVAALDEAPQPTRARKRSSERTAMPLRRSTETKGQGVRGCGCLLGSYRGKRRGGYGL